MARAAAFRRGPFPARAEQGPGDRSGGGMREGKVPHAFRHRLETFSPCVCGRFSAVRGARPGKKRDKPACPDPLTWVCIVCIVRGVFRNKRMKTQPLPFSVNRNDARSLVDQVADGMRQAIVSGHWRVGDELPSTRELVPLLGVSHIVTRAALARLADEGYVLTRHGLHPTVRDRAAKQWLGHVVFACPEGDENYAQTVIAGVLRDRLSEAGYRFTQACLPQTSPQRYDFSHLEAALSQSTDLVVTMFARRHILAHLGCAGIARGNIQLSEPGALRNLPCKGVLTAAAAK